MSSLSSNSKVYLFCGAILATVVGVGVFTALDKTENLVPQVVATQTIEPRTQITERMLTVKNVPALGRSEASLDDPALVVGGFATTRIYAEQPIIQPMVAKQFDETGASGLALSIQDSNLRAISFPVSPADVVGGKIKKGDYVDLIASFDASKLQTETNITKAILQGVEVFDYSSENGYITLLLTLEQIEIVKHAYAVGTITYALTPGDSARATTTGIINKSLCERFHFSCSKK